MHAFQQRAELLKRQNRDGAEALERREEDKKGGAREMGQVCMGERVRVSPISVPPISRFHVPPALGFMCAQVVLAIRNVFLRCATTMTTKTSVGHLQSYRPGHLLHTSNQRLLFNL